MSQINKAVLKLAQENPEFRTALVAELKTAGLRDDLAKAFHDGRKMGFRGAAKTSESDWNQEMKRVLSLVNDLRKLKAWWGPLGTPMGTFGKLENALHDTAHEAGVYAGNMDREELEGRSLRASDKTALDKSTPRNVSMATMGFAVTLDDLMKAGKKLQRLFKKHPVIDPENDWGRGEAAERELAKILDLLKKWQRATPMMFGVYADSPMHRQGADKWKKKPKGWTDESRKKFWNTLTSAAPKHKVTECIKRMDKHMDGNAGAFCASLADRVTPGWRQEAAKDKKKKASLTQPLGLRRDYGAGSGQDEWLDQEEVREHCPPCADKMAANGIRKVKASTLRLAMQRR